MGVKKQNNTTGSGRGKMSGKGAKGLVSAAGKAPSSSSTKNNLNKDKKKATTRSSRAGLQVFSSASFYLVV